MKRKEISDESIHNLIKQIRQYEEISNILNRLYFSKETWGYYADVSSFLTNLPKNESTSATTTTTTTSTTATGNNSSSSGISGSNSNTTTLFSPSLISLVVKVQPPSPLSNLSPETKNDNDVIMKALDESTNKTTSTSSTSNIKLTPTSTSPTKQELVSPTTTTTTTTTTPTASNNSKKLKKPIRFKGWTKLVRESTSLASVYKKKKSLCGTLLTNPINELFSSPLPNLNELTIFQLSYLEETLASLKQQLGIPREPSINVSNYIKQNFEHLKQYLNSSMPKTVYDSMVNPCLNTVYFTNDALIAMRPYMTHAAREILEQKGLHYFYQNNLFLSNGDPLHVPFSRLEKEILLSKVGKDRDTPMNKMIKICKSLPGRVPIDCMRFLEDYDIDKHESNVIRYVKEVKKLSTSAILMEREIGRQKPHNSNKQMLGFKFEDFGLHSRYHSRGGIVHDVKIDPTGRTNKILAMTDTDSTLFDPDNKKAKKLEFHNSACNEGHFSMDGQELLTSGNDGSVAIWSASNAELLHSHNIRSEKIVRMTVHPQEPFLVAATEQKSLCIINYKNFTLGDLNASLKTSEWPATVADMAFGYDAHRNYLIAGICSPNSASSIKAFSVLIDCHKPEVNTKLYDQDGEVNAVSWNPKNTTHFVCGSTDKKKPLCIYDVRKQTAAEFIKTKQLDQNQLSWSMCGVHLASAGNDNSVFVYDTRYSSRPLHILMHNGDFSEMVSAAKWTKQGNYLITCGEDCTVRIWDIARGDPLVKCLKYHNGAVNYVDVSLYSDYIVSGGDDSVVNIYSTTKDVHIE